MKKRVLSFLLCLCLCVGLFPGTALASDEAEAVLLQEPTAEESAENIPALLDGDGQGTTYSVSFSDNLGPEGSVLVAVNSSAEEDFSVMTDTDSLTLSAEDVVYLKANPEEEYPINRVLTIVGMGEEVQGFASIIEQDGVYTLSGCSMDCAIRIEFDAGSGNGPGEGPVGPPDPPAEDWVVNFELVYDGTDPGTTGGGIDVYNEDGTIRETVTASGPVTVPGGTKFLCLPLDVKGLAVSMQGQNGTESGMYARYESGTIKAVYTVDNGSSGPSGPGPGGGPTAASKSFFVQLDITYPKGYEGDGYVVFQVDKDNNFAAFDQHYKDGDTIEIGAGEWALFGYEEINGETAVWQGSTMGGGLYGLADEPRDEGETVILSLVYGAEAQGPGDDRPDIPPLVPAYTITLDITYPDSYTGEDNGGIQFEETPVVTLKGDGAVSSPYEIPKNFAILELPGLTVESAEVVCNCTDKCDHVQTSVTPDGITRYLVTGAVTVSIVYAEIDYGDIAVWLDQPSEENVGLYSALLTARYSMPSLLDHDIRVYYSRVDSENARGEMNTYSNYTRSFTLRQDRDGNYYCPEEIKNLLPNTEYYARAVLVLQDYTLVSEPIQFTTDDGTLPSVIAAPVEGEYSGDVEFIPCTVNGVEQDITFSYMDGLNGADGVPNTAITQFKVAEDGIYRITLNYEEPATLPGGYAYVFSRLYTMDVKGELQPLEDAAAAETVAGFFVGDPPGPGGATWDEEKTYADVELSKDVTYYLGLDFDAGTATVSVELLNPDYEVDFSITANPAHYGTDDSKPHAVRAMINYSVSGYYHNGYRLDVQYGQKSVYEQTGKFERNAEWHNPTSYQEHDDWEERVRLSHCIDGLEYVYFARLVDCTTGAVLAESEVVEFTADMTYIRSFRLGENRNTPENRVIDADGHMSECFFFGSDVVMNRFVPGETGRYLFNANGNRANIEIYDAAGELLATSTAGHRWASVSLELTEGNAYYVLVEDLTCVTPIVTVSFLQSGVNTDERVEISTGGTDVALDRLESTVNDLTKDEEGNAAELPSYVETDEDGEAALREAIETGDSLTAEITGKELAEGEVDESVAAAMESAALVVADTETAEVLLYLDLSVLLRLGEEEIAKLTETGEEITFCIPITEELSQLIDNKALYVIRYHNGAAESIALEVSEQDGCIYFSSDLFSTFALYAAETNVRNGIYAEDGSLYYYENGVHTYAGLMYLEEDTVWDGVTYEAGYYYVRTSGQVVCGRNYYITKSNDLLPVAGYTFDDNGTMVLPRELQPGSPEKEQLTGIYEVEGTLYYYENGVRTYKGLMYLEEDTVWDGVTYEAGYYYVRTSGQVVCDRSYYITKSNDLLPVANYTFDENGTMVLPRELQPGSPEKEQLNGIYEVEGTLYYYENGIRTYKGMMYLEEDTVWDGVTYEAGYYYVRTSGEVVRGRNYYITKSNDLLPVAGYTFDNNGKMIEK